MSPSPDIAYAHSLEGQPIEKWERLEDHLNAVAERAARFCEPFGAAEWGRLAGLWHDLGKYSPDFQNYITGRTASGPPHAWAGAFLAGTRLKTAVPLAFAIAGHHSGLADLRADATLGSSHGPTPLQELLGANKREFAALKNSVPDKFMNLLLPPLPRFLTETSSMLRIAMFTRFLFSALVDADRVETSKFYARFLPALTADNLKYDDLLTLRDRLDQAIDRMSPKGSPAVIDLRRQVLLACRNCAGRKIGRFSLTVPTGGGKTLSAMSFALNHAIAQKLKRVIVVIPYTSIIEQSARVYKDILGSTNVLEHHSNLDEQKLTELDSRGEQLRKLAAENWDAPIIVTTTVQFFQSLLANHPGRCRKLHNIANSVIVLDEVQTLPPQFLRTIIDVLGQLTEHYGSSVVLTTATPPALAAQGDSSPRGLTGVHEIMPDPITLAKQVRRVFIEWRIDAPTSYEELAKEIQGIRQVLAIVHRRDDARRLAEAVDGNVLHLSAGMCPAHRMEIVTEIRRRLAAGKPCILVSTQLVEAGVDLDFPVVFRSLAGLDSIAQSAGRCDREGRLTDAAGGIPAGRLVVFRAETDPPLGVPQKALESMHVLLKLGDIDPFNPNDSIRFFNELYRKIDDDEKRIEWLRSQLMFATVAERFRMIDSDT